MTKKPGPGIWGAFLILNALSSLLLWHSPAFFWLPTSVDRALSLGFLLFLIIRRFDVTWPDIKEHFRRYADAYLVVILGVGAWGVRRIGLYFGLPFCYGIDEPYIVQSSIRMIQTGDFNPHRFHYPSLGFYLTAAALARGFLLEAGKGLYLHLSQMPDYVSYYYARHISALIGAITVPSLYLLGRRTIGRYAAFLGAGLLAVSHLAAENGRNAGFHGMAPLLVLAALGAGFRYLDTRSAGWAIFSGALAGLAFSTMYYCSTVLPVVIFLVWLDGYSKRSNGYRLALTGCMLAAAAFAFFLTTPYAVLDMPNFVNQFAERLSLSVSRGNIGLGGAGGITARNYSIGYLAAFGLLAACLFLGDAFLTIKLRDRHRLLLFGFVVLHFGFMSSYRAAFSRYLAPLEPLYLLLVADGCVRVIGWMRSRLRIFVWLPASIFMIGTLFYAPVQKEAQWYCQTSEPVACLRAYTWIQANLNPKSLFLLEERTPFLPWGFNHQLRLDRVIDLSVEQCRQRGVEYIVVSQSYSTRNLENDRKYRWYLRKLNARPIVSFAGNHNLQNPAIDIYQVPPRPDKSGSPDSPGMVPSTSQLDHRPRRRLHGTNNLTSHIAK